MPPYRPLRATLGDSAGTGASAGTDLADDDARPANGMNGQRRPAASVRRVLVPAQRHRGRRGLHATQRGHAVRQPGRFSRLFGRLAMRAADVASRVGTRWLGSGP
ncbi:MAG TPA: hypothetical protein VH442_09820, partial [Micromonosporaceae bacterium]